MVEATAGYLLPGPFCAALDELVDEHGVGGAADRLGVHERQLYRWLHEPVIPRVELVDEALTRAGIKLAELYGETPALTERDRRGTCRQCGEHLRTPAPLCGFCLEEAAL